MYRLFDSQINSGTNYFGPTSSLADYINYMPNNTKKAIVIPTATHVLEIETGKTEISCIWNYDKGIKFSKNIITNGINIKTNNPKSPYSLMNLKTLNEIRDHNRRKNNITLYFCPKFHPHLDTESDIDLFINAKETIAVKIQGLATFSGPNDIPAWFIKKLKYLDIPLIVHTHCNNHNYYDNDRNPYFHYICELNQPLNWIVFALKHDIRIYLAHGMRLCRYSAKLVNSHDNFLVGIGPEILLNNEKYSLFIDNENYLESLLQLVDTNKVAYSTDFAWNIHRRNEWANYDWCSHERIITFLQNKEMSSAVDNILYVNANHFFGMAKTIY